MYGLPYADPAKVARCPVGTIRSRVARARSSLAEMLAAEEPDTGRRFVPVVA
ncbi:hypothetical protein [Streptomyces sp. enrichment culture]|uniref:hypothetical protein n=1 Tax=Streptomyces sp. enrichment culture TaxID=1795815 RepID=UPI003F5440F9